MGTGDKDQVTKLHPATGLTPRVASHLPPLIRSFIHLGLIGVNGDLAVDGCEE